MFLKNEKAFDIHYKDISVSKDIYTLLRNHKLVFCDDVTTGIKNLFISINFFFSWFYHKLKETG